MTGRFDPCGVLPPVPGFTPAGTDITDGETLGVAQRSGMFGRPGEDRSPRVRSGAAGPPGRGASP